MNQLFLFPIPGVTLSSLSSKLLVQIYQWSSRHEIWDGNIGSHGHRVNVWGSYIIYFVASRSHPRGRGGCEDTHVIGSLSLAEASSRLLRSNFRRDMLLQRNVLLSNGYESDLGAVCPEILELSGSTEL